MKKFQAKSSSFQQKTRSCSKICPDGFFVMSGFLVSTKAKLNDAIGHTHLQVELVQGQRFKAEFFKDNKLTF